MDMSDFNYDNSFAFKQSFNENSALKGNENNDEREHLVGDMDN